MVRNGVQSWMNLLGHAIFTDGPDDVLFGAFVNDLLKSHNEIDNLYPQIRDGRIIHRKLDGFFDSLEQLKPVRRQLFDVVRHWQNPVLDLCADYIIASNWDSLFSRDLKSFVSVINDIVLARIDLFPQDRQKIVQGIVEKNLLLSYADLEGLKIAIDRLARRAKAETRSEIIIDKKEEIIKTLPDISPIVLAALPEIKKFTDESMRELGYDVETRLHWLEKESFGENSDHRLRHK